MSFQEFKPRQFQQLPMVVKNILIINVVLFAGRWLLEGKIDLDRYLDLFPIGTEYFKWYDLAVSKNFPITRLYECYMMSMNLMDEVVIPKRVLMYFSYQSELPVAQNAYLYAYVIKNSEKYPDIIASFKGQIDRFVIK